jgi:hypothetical protein
MAKHQFNAFDPQLDPVSGRQAQEPRVFAHDAVAIVVGAVNHSWSDGGASIGGANTGYNGGVATTTTGTATATLTGTGTGLTVDCTVETGGAISAITVNAPGSGYAVGDTVSVRDIGGTGSPSCVLTITNVDIPNTQKRGCCIYVGAAAGLATLSVVMESGNTAVFNTLSAGTILPILIKRITTAGLAANDVIALY